MNEALSSRRLRAPYHSRHLLLPKPTPIAASNRPNPNQLANVCRHACSWPRAAISLSLHPAPAGATSRAASEVSFGSSVDSLLRPEKKVRPRAGPRRPASLQMRAVCGVATIDALGVFRLAGIGTCGRAGGAGASGGGGWGVGGWLLCCLGLEKPGVWLQVGVLAASIEAWGVWLGPLGAYRCLWRVWLTTVIRLG